MDLTKVFIFLFVLMLAQAIGTYVQVQQYKKAVRRLHKLGNVGIGSKRGKLSRGNIVLIACDRNGVITAGKIMEGFTIFTTFKDLSGIVGKTIYTLKDEYVQLPEKQKKKYKAHMQALDALELRLNPIEE
ncbi:transcriptional regulator GutM [Anaerosinus massiliensis]|uniref:transcriptional regulator GutM n=1 Tax=Massilibacillus massiliensis TaxID=1806837 RepID=UPI000DA61255|nr:transcriptional regulator GutM [Massilibacillus massiliensis]